MLKVFPWGICPVFLMKSGVPPAFAAPFPYEAKKNFSLLRPFFSFPAHPGLIFEHNPSLSPAAAPKKIFRSSKETRPIRR
jgi:hypothetical protein